MTRASLDKRPAEVAAMFDRVARRYDRMNSLMSLGLDRYWRRATRRALELRPGERCLDLAAGTGVSTVELARSGAWVVGADISLGMLRAGQGRSVPLLAGDALALPFADASLDAVTISFGLRNVVDVPAALGEMARVTRPGGRLVVCEASHPASGLVREVYLRAMGRAIPMLARVVSSNAEAYEYFAESVRDWPDKPALAKVIADSGWRDVAWRSLTGGVVALHRATRGMEGAS